MTCRSLRYEKASRPPNKVLHADGAPVPRFARHGAPRVSTKAFGGRALCRVGQAGRVPLEP
jgi:hypothetical protein